MSDLPDGYVLVEVVPLGGAPGAYTYAVPPHLAPGAGPGRRVLVPFGARRRAAIVLGSAERAPDGPLRVVEALLDDGPLLTPEVLRLARWAGEYYAAPLSHALRAALPPGADAKEAHTPVLAEAGRLALAAAPLDPRTRKALLAVQANEVQLVAPGTLRRLVKEGLVDLVREVKTGRAPPTAEFVARAAQAPPVFTPRQHLQKAVWEALAGGPLALKTLSEQVPGGREAARRMAARGLLRLERRPLATLFGTPEKEGPAVDLTKEQAQALGALIAALDAPEPRPFLLEGVTGSGKTEVYLRLIRAARDRGEGALVLVPEIALTPQLAGRFRARFGDEVAVLHSGLAERDRLAEWHRVRRGEAPIVVGARSAVFAPLGRPRVIVVDEEHDGSFKQDGGLRYHGRDLAVVRARDAGAVVVLGSATPSLETLHNAAAGRYEHLRLPSRVDARPMPAVELVDLRARARARVESGMAPSGLLSPELVSALHETVARGEQAIVFLNRRGHSTALLCRDCGVVRRCESCSVAMTWHERRRRLICHCCGARAPVPTGCEGCGSTRLLLTGAGTEKVEEELLRALPSARMERMDRDAVGSARRLEELLGRFSRGDIDVLVGTQMVAKGHDFPGVTLVCVLLADAGLHQPDFRAGERTAQLLTQVAGRAGRGQKPGRVLVQTFAPDTPAVMALLAHDYGAFARAELAERRAALYPPFCRLCLVRVEGPEEEAAAAVANALAKHLAEPALAELQLLGPAPAPVARMRGRYRFQLLLKAGRPTAVRAAIARLRSAPRPPSAVRVSIDVDPVDLL